MINKVELIGRLGADPEIKILEGGTRLAKISIGTTESWKDKNSGEKKEETSWHNVTFFGKLAENAELLLQKGSLVYVEGKLKYSNADSPDGTKRKFTDINARDFRILKDGKTREASQNNSSSATNNVANKEEVATFVTEGDDDLPF